MKKHVTACFVAVAGTIISLSAFADASHYLADASVKPATPPEPRATKVSESEETQRAGQRLRDKLSDGSAGPEMIVVPGGRFKMGSPGDEANRASNEGPLHEVRLKAFALGRTQIKREEFATFVRATKYKTDAERNNTPAGKPDRIGCFGITEKFTPGWKQGSSWRDPGYPQDDDHPVVCISWNDATAYVEWLRKETGKSYRLPSEAELEYAIRAGSDAPWPWGSDANGGCATSNGADETGKAGMRKKFGLAISLMFAASSCEDGFVFTAPVGRLKPNAFGLYDMVGNAYEWSQDCYHSSYAQAPVDGSAFVESDCSQHVIRSGAWSDEPAFLRSAIRSGMTSSSRYHNVGMRIAQDL